MFEAATKRPYTAAQHAPGLVRLLTQLHGLAPAGEPDVDVAALCAAAHADGETAGRAAAEAALEPVRAIMAAASEALAASAQIDPDTLQPMFIGLVERVCAAALMAELRLAPDALRPLVEAALAAAGGRAARLRLHPETLAALDLDMLAVEVTADPALGRDAVAIDGPAFALETSLTERLAVIVAALP